ncbi:translation initiation factor IF-2-like [Ischnura elegans]|uniref:translation initiation factor IF-2-like n=1 Tax=Ischnura elegans TaxID=197161 RepID=UPI001ED8B71E|nr:translation initiation factor IF-2-like [Ischnura elegans]
MTLVTGTQGGPSGIYLIGPGTKSETYSPVYTERKDKRDRRRRRRDESPGESTWREGKMGESQRRHSETEIAVSAEMEYYSTKKNNPEIFALVHTLADKSLRERLNPPHPRLPPSVRSSAQSIDGAPHVALPVAAAAALRSRPASSRRHSNSSPRRLLEPPPVHTVRSEEPLVSPERRPRRVRPPLLPAAPDGRRRRPRRTTPPPLPRAARPPAILGRCTARDAGPLAPFQRRDLRGRFIHCTHEGPGPLHVIVGGHFADNERTWTGHLPRPTARHQRPQHRREEPRAAPARLPPAHEPTQRATADRRLPQTRGGPQEKQCSRRAGLRPPPPAHGHGRPAVLLSPRGGRPG